jgi:hypothetical protein
MRTYNRNSQTLECKVCGDEVLNCGHESVKVTCSVCVQKSLEEFNRNKPENVQDNDRDSKEWDC